MNLNVFKEAIKRKEITVDDEGRYIDVFYSGRLCAKISMDNDFAYLIDTSVVPVTFRRQLASIVKKFTNVPFHKRRNCTVAKHSNYKYIKSMDTGDEDGLFIVRVEMTPNIEEADKCITEYKRSALTGLFGKEIRYVEVSE